MSDFFNGFWSIYITVVTLAGIAGVGWLLFAMSKARVDASKPTDGSIGDTGHVWDEDLRELNNPLPRWWLWLFVITILFGLVYLTLYPGLGTYKGTLGFSSVGEHDADRTRAEAQARDVYGAYMKMDIKQIAADARAREIGQRLFLNYCAQCHGSDGNGSKGFPNLADSDWLYGGEPDAIRATILKGRNGMMPPFGGQIDGTQAVNVANYVRSLSGLSYDPIKASAGESIFKTVCAACHGAAGTGNQALGAPNLTDKVWLYGSAQNTIVETILKGRSNHMPAHEAILTPEKVQMLTAYVYGLSRQTLAIGQ